MKNLDLHRNIVAQSEEGSQTSSSGKIPLHFGAAHDIIKKVSPETRLAIYRIEAVCAAFPLHSVYYDA